MPLVGHVNAEKNAVVVGLDETSPDRHPAALGELDGVGEQVEEHLAEAQRVARRLTGRSAAISQDRVRPLAARSWTMARGAVDDGGHGEIIVLQGNAVGF